MVQTAVTDIIGPTIAADDPDGFLNQAVSHADQIFRAVSSNLKFLFKSLHGGWAIDAGSSPVRH